MAEETEALLARAAAAIAECRRLTATQRMLLEDMSDIYACRLGMAMRAANRLQLSEEELVERYRRLVQS